MLQTSAAEVPSDVQAAAAGIENGISGDFIKL